MAPRVRALRNTFKTFLHQKKLAHSGTQGMRGGGKCNIPKSTWKGERCSCDITVYVDASGSRAEEHIQDLEKKFVASKTENEKKQHQWSTWDRERSGCDIRVYVGAPSSRPEKYIQDFLVITSAHVAE